MCFTIRTGSCKVRPLPDGCSYCETHQLLTVRLRGMAVAMLKEFPAAHELAADTLEHAILQGMLAGFTRDNPGVVLRGILFA